MTVRVEIKFNRLNEIQGQMRQRAGSITRKAALDIAKDARSRVPVDRGDLKDSIEAEKLDSFAWEISAGTDHAGFVEFGTAHMPAEPYLIPAAEAQRGPYLDAMKRLVDG